MSADESAKWIDTVVDHAPEAGLVFFFVFFMAILVWVFRPGSRAYYQKQAKIPLMENDNGQ